MVKILLREIQSQKGRFAALFAIVAIGVAFYAGLYASLLSMRQSAQAYYARADFFDLGLVSTQGFTLEEADSIQGQPGLSLAEGQISIEAYAQGLGSGAQAVQILSLPREANAPVLLAGRLPQRAGECVADSRWLGKGDLGRKIQLEAPDPHGEWLSPQEAEVVGIVSSPLYIHSLRGSTSLGDGRLQGYLYLPWESFSHPSMPDGQEIAYTHVYLQLEKNHPGLEQIYAPAYEEFVKKQTKLWEERLSSMAQARYIEAKAQLWSDLEEARLEIEATEEEHRGDLEEAQEKLQEERAKLDRGRRDLDAGARQLAQARKDWQRGAEEIQAGAAALEEGRSRLDEARESLEAGIREWEVSSGQLNAGHAQWQRGMEEWQTQNGQMQLMRQAHTQAGAELEAAKAAKAAGLLPAEAAQALDVQIAQWEAAAEQISAGEVRLLAAKAQLDQAKAEIDQGSRAMDRAWMEIEAGRGELFKNEALLEAEAARLEDAKRELESARVELDAQEAVWISQEAKWQQGNRDWTKAEEDWRQGLRELEEELAQAREEWTQGYGEWKDFEAPKTYALDRESNAAYASFERDTLVVGGIAELFPVFFVAVAVLVCMTTMGRMVAEHRLRIGLYKALGYGRGFLLALYGSYASLAAVLGGLAGFLGGSALFPQAIWSAFAMSYDLGDLQLYYSLSLALQSVGGAAVFLLLATLWTVWSSFGESPAQLMRPKAPKSGRKILLEKLPFLWSRMGFLAKVCARNLLLYKGRLFMMVLGISGSAALLLAGFGLRDSFGQGIGRHFLYVHTYDIHVILAEDFDGENTRLELPEAVEAFLPMAEEKVELSASSQLLSEEGTVLPTASLWRLEKDQAGEDILHLRNLEGNPLDPPAPDEIYLSQALSASMGLEDGDRLWLRDEEGQIASYAVGAICENYFSQYAYVSDSGSAKRSLYLRVEPGEAESVKTALLAQDAVLSAITAQEVQERVDEMVGNLALVFSLVLLSAAALALVVLYNLTNINLMERVREIATFKVLGFYPRETRAFVFWENIVLTLLGMGLGLVLGRWLHLRIMGAIPFQDVYFAPLIRPWSYLWSAMAVMGLTLAVNLMMGRRLDAIPMAESLKSVE